MFVCVDFMLTPRHERWRGELFVRNVARVRRVALRSVVSNACDIDRDMIMTLLCFSGTSPLRLCAWI